MNKFVLSVVSILMASSLFAAPPEAPVKLFAGSINGYVCFHLQVSADATLTPVFQCKPPETDDSAWTIVDLAKMADSFFTSKFIGYNKPVWYAGAMQFRVCYENTEKETSVWTDLGTVTNSVCHLHYSRVSEREFGDIRNSNITDGNTVFPLENAEKYAGHLPVWVGIRFERPVTTSKIRYVPRQDNQGQVRLARCYLECADDETFETNCRNLGSFPAATDIELGKVLEFNLEQPVTAQYFRICHNGDDFLCIAELEITAAEMPKEILVAADVPDITNGYAQISWNVPLADQCASSCVERAVSPAGPFVQVVPWGDAAGTFVDTDMKVGVPYYYRVRALCVGEGPISPWFTSDLVLVHRAKRLDRDWNDLTKLRDGIRVMYPYYYLGSTTMGETSPTTAFDNDLSTSPECKCPVPTEWRPSDPRAFNGAVGVDLGADYHISGVYAYPRENNPIRLSMTALYGGTDEADTNTWDRLTDTFNNQYVVKWCYMKSEDESGLYRFAFIRAPGDVFQGFYCSVAELGFFGYCDQDVIDSGVLVPPSSVTATGTAQNVTVSWTEGATVESYEVERRVAGGEWMTVAELPPTVLAFTDYAAPEGVSLEYRVTAHGADDEYAYSYVNASIVPGPGTAQVPPVEIVRSEDLSTLAAVVSWSGCGGTYLRHGTLQRSVSPYGPFTDLKELDHPVASFTMTDLTAVPGVAYYYRVRFVCDDPLAPELGEIASAPVPFVRARRLERDESDLTTLREGVQAIPPFRYLGYEGEGELSGAEGGAGDHRVRRVFDNDTTSFCELKYPLPGRTEAEWGYQYRALNGAIGVDLGGACHIIGVNAHPRQDGSADRLGPHAIWGGSDSYDSNTWTRISQTYNEKYGSVSKTDFHWYYVPSDDSETTYRCVFLWGVGPRGIFEGTYCNVAEMAIYGWSENDAADSGLVFAPTEISVSANTAVMVISWNAGVNVDSYLVQRRTSAAEAWTDVATLPSTALSYADGEKLKKGHYEFRVIAKGADDTEAWTAVVGCDFEPKRGMLLIVR